MTAAATTSRRTITGHCLGCGTVVAYTPGQPSPPCNCKKPGDWRFAPAMKPPAAAPAAPPPGPKPNVGDAAEDELDAQLANLGYRNAGVAFLVPELMDFGALYIPQFAWGWFLKPKRKFHSDFAFPAAGVLVEIEGQVHAIKGRRKDDVRRRQAAEAAGWRVVSVLPEQVRDGTALEIVRDALAAGRS